MTTITQFITAEEFAAMSPPVDGSKQELVRGEIVTMSRPKPRHGFVQANIGALLIHYTKPNRLGWVFLESGVILEREPDTVRGPDVCFYSITRLPDVPDDFFEIPPDIVVEVLSPNDRRRAIQEKISEYITAGTTIVWVVDPVTRTVMVYAGSTRGVEHGEDDIITGGDVLPGFACKVAEFFE